VSGGAEHMSETRCGCSVEIVIWGPCDWSVSWVLCAGGLTRLGFCLWTGSWYGPHVLPKAQRGDTLRRPVLTPRRMRVHTSALTAPQHLGFPAKPCPPAFSEGQVFPGSLGRLGFVAGPPSGCRFFCILAGLLEMAGTLPQELPQGVAW
jgi:hypothetical protein